MLHIFIFILWIIAVLGVIGIEINSYLRFTNNLNLPFKDFKKTELKTVDNLYTAYKKLPKTRFKIVKMQVRAWNKSEIVPQTIDAFMKIIISIILTTTGVVVTILISSLNLADSNKENDPTQSSNWNNTITNILDNFTQGISSYITLINIALLLFLLSFIHISISYWKNSLYKKHLIVIEEIEKEY